MRTVVTVGLFIPWGFHMTGYYHPEHLARFGTISEGSKELADKFFDYYAAVFREGALSEREKALIALAVAHAVQCPYCIDAYSRTCLEKGADLEQMTEAVHVATAIRGGASLVHGIQMLEHVKQAGM
jgi:alkylhydroperoxidase/carboxymuconolactone decarboxylase family protein